MGVQKDLRELQLLFGEITNRLSAVGDKVTDSDPSFYWLKEVKDVAYDFDDMLYHLEAEKHKADSDSHRHASPNFFAKTKSALSRFEMAQEIKKIKKRFAKIVKQRTDVNAIANSMVFEHPIRHVNKTVGEMSILVNIDETKVLGRDEVRRKIVSKLVNSDAQEKISVVSIVGLGGSCKTTLAKYICQDKIIEKHFESIWWVHVSQEFNVEKLIGKLFESVTNEKSELHTLQRMSRIISERLSKRKFLLVFDDVWSEDQHEWEQFEQHFNRGAPGSKILLTTRDGKVAEVVKSADVFSLAFLSDADSWKLCQQRSGWAEEGLDSEFIEVGKEIVKKCAGVPLAIKSLGGVLRDKRQIREWQALRDSDLLNDLDIKDRVLGSLRLSYFHLSDNLKQCFLICSIFPKGYRIDKDHLISLWIAHGFINPVNGGQLSEDVGSNYFDSLLKVSFLQDVYEDRHDVTVSCKMHDLVHDLSRQIVQNELVLIPGETTTDYNQRCRYLSIGPCTDKVDRKLFKKIRALYVAGGGFATDKPIEKGCCVRSVILEDIKDASVPQFVLKFEYLAHLRISKLNCRELPDAISSCWNLQSLHVTYCSNLAMLPESIGKLKKLRTLELSHSANLESLPLSIGDCKSLESLQLIHCRNFRAIPDSMCKNEMLRTLKIINCESLRQLPSESFATLQNLWTINLRQCTSLEDLPRSLACVELRTLKLHKVKRLVILPQCITSLSNLEHLDLGYCINLVELPQGIRKLKRLQVLNLEGCYKLQGLPAGFGHLRQIQSLGLFVIGGGMEHARISELGNLDMISGLLEIAGIRSVKDVADAEKAYLKRKNNIKELKLDWLSGGNISEEMSMENLVGTNAEEEDLVEQELGVLNGLEPPCGIKKLEIFDYHGLHLPCWILRERDSCNSGSLKQIVDLCHFPNLTSMVLAYFPKLKHLARLVGLPSLKTLILVSFDALESVSACPFPSLEELHVAGMLQLVELSTTSEITLADGDGDGVIVCGNQAVQCCFPRLTSLHISDCPKLNVKPWFPASLTSLTLQICNEQLLSPVRSLCAVHPRGNELESPSFCSNLGEISCLSIKKLELSGMTAISSGSSWELLLHLTVLELLQIRQCSKLMQLPESLGSLTSLQRLLISDCPGLCELPERLGELCSLQSLEIYGCKNLRGLPEGIQYLTSLQNLHIKSCSAFQQLPEVGLGSLSSLRRLFMSGLPSLSGLPESIRDLNSLEHVEIGLCHSLNCLPEQLGELHSLQNLAIWGLPALTCLPESMERLTSLHELTINDCDALTVPMEWIGQLSALRSLRIIGCHGITSLPCSMERLTALQTLYISDNPDLARRCQQGAGEDWHLISRIPNVHIW